MANMKGKSINISPEPPKFPYRVIPVSGGRGARSSSGNLGLQVLQRQEELQFIYMPLGRIAIHMLETTVELTAGEGIFLNKNVPYYIEELGSCFYYCYVFPEKCLKFYGDGPAGSLVDSYIEDARLPYYVFDGNAAWQENVLEGLRQLLSLESRKGEQYPYEVLVGLTGIWLEMMRHIEIPVPKKRRPAVTRMLLFLQFIENHYREEVTLEALSASAGVSKSECLRCFKQILQTTPYKYLMDYRLVKAADLLHNTDRQISEIAVLTGFDQPSYFGKCFRERIGCTPKTYRNRFLAKGKEKL